MTAKLESQPSQVATGDVPAATGVTTSTDGAASPENGSRRGQREPSYDAPPIPPNRTWEALQRLIGLLALVLTLPISILAFVLVKLTSRGPFLFAQMRRGLGGKPFLVYKIRTLRLHAEHATALGVATGEPSVTAVGRVLRKLKIDEIPQFWNIATGTMNLVGPRPIPLALQTELERYIPDFGERHRVKPGLSSLAQIAIIENQLGLGLVADWQLRFEAELHYIRNKSVAYDFAVIVLTALYVLRSVFSFGRRGARKRPSSATAVAPSRRTATRVLGAPIADLDYEGVVTTTAEWVTRKQSEYVAIAPVHSVVEGVLGQAHRDALDGAGLVTADGMPIVWAQKLLGNRNATRVYGPTLMLNLLDRAALEGWRVGFYGGAPDTLNVLADRLQLRYPKLQIACAISPPFRQLSQAEDDDMVARINASNPDLLFVGLGCPKQEQWMHQHRSRLQTVQFGVGAAFSFHAGQLRQAPALLQRVGLEWLFRLCCEPRRLFKRYATTNPIFVARFGMQLFAMWILRRKFRQPLHTDDRNRNA